MYTKHIKLILSLFLSASLLGCAAVAVGAVVAAGTGVAVATDPRNSGVVIDDSGIQRKLNNIYSDYPDSNIYVNSYNGGVLLTGQVATNQMKESAAFEARATPGVKKLYNYLDVRLPQSVASASTDGYTTTQVRAKLLGVSDLNSNDVKVVTTNDVVYLFGVVTVKQGQDAAKAAASIGGVSKVITLFQYVTVN